MEDKLITKPCAVQKIETSQGFSVSYNGHFLYSKYNPSKNITALISKLNILPGTIILCCSPLLGYGLNELLLKLPENCILILIEADKNLYDFTIEQDICKTNDTRIFFCPFEKLNELPLYVFNLASNGNFRRVIRVDFSAGIQFNSDLYNQLFAACSDSVMTFWKNRITLTKFGRRYSRNLFENLKYLSQTRPITDFFEKVKKTILVFGAGESTQLFLDNNQIKKEHFFILCADTALIPLIKNGITPDGVFVEEAQSVITKAFIGVKNTTQIFAGLSSIPNIIHQTNPSKISYFFTEYTQGTFFDSLKQKDFSPPANKPFGSVGITTVYYALKFRKNDSVPVYVTGLDFSYSTGKTHTKNALAHILRIINKNRLTSVENFAAAFSLGAQKVTGKNNAQIITNPSLKTYSAMFNSLYAGTKNLFDASETGIPLAILKGLPLCDSSNKTNNSIIKETKFSEKQNNNIQDFLAQERTALKYLRDLLTGKTELKDKTLLSEIKKIAEPREYLYLHFADGYKFSIEQSFLNRIRTEIDFFLKFM